MRRRLKKGLAVLLTTSMMITSLINVSGQSKVNAASSKTVALGAGSYSTEVRGTWSYYANGGEVVNTNASLLDKLPYGGSIYRKTTDNYTGPFDTSDWATSFMWDLNGTNPYSCSVFAIPFSFNACTEGMMVTSPTTIMDKNNDAYLMFMPQDGSLTDFIVKPDFAFKDAKVDKVTDWTYDVVMEESSNKSRYMKTTMVQGSPFAFFEFANSNKATIVRKRNGLHSAVAWYNGDSIENSNILLLRVYDNADETAGYESHDYYAVYAPEGTKFTVNLDGANIGSIQAEFPTDRSYFTFATICSTYGIEDEQARIVCNTFKPYAYNFITDTKADYSYNEKTGILSTDYKYTVEKKAESTAEGTIMGILPHQYKNIKNGEYLDHTYRTIRGKMKFMEGSSFTTQLKYSGFIPNMPDVASSDKSQLQTYVTNYMNQYENNLFSIDNGSGDTYWTGKALNRVVNVLAAAETCGDEASADILYNGLKQELEDWFSTNDTETEKYFYYDSELGTLFGFPQSYSSVDQINDHHFHYGYYIYAAAQIALRDPQWASDGQYGAMVKELIGDIACGDRDSNRYPYLRNFSAYEGHSWASGHQQFPDGNNQESSSEALNAWAGIIMFGEATGNKELRDLGIYLYTTEISSVNNYWFDVDRDVLDDRYRYDVDTLEDLDKTTAKVVRNQASMVWGAKYIYGTWWTAEPLQVQGINLLPMNPASFYLAGNPDYIKENLELALYHEKNYTGSDKLSDPSDRWNDIWSEYQALADPDYALTYWDTQAAEESGESRAHTYHYIKSLQYLGTPDTSITSDCVLSSVFDKDGVKTYAAYNVDNTAKTVTFSDGIQITAKPGQLTTVKSTEISNVKNYTIEYYTEKADGTGYEKETVSKKGMQGSTVTVPLKEIYGFYFDTSNGNNTLSGTLTDNSLVLKAYYKRNTYTLQFDTNDGVMETSNPTEYKYGQSFTFNEPVKKGYIFEGWYTDSTYKTQITGITPDTQGNLILVAKWKDPKLLEVESGKVVTGTKDSVVFTLSGVDNITNAIVHFKLYDTKEEAEEVDTNAGMPGYILTDEDQDGTYTYEYKVAEGESGKYMALCYNVIINGTASLSKFRVYQIPTEVWTDVTYQTQHYKENTNGQYELADVIYSKAESGIVSATQKIYKGYALDETHTGNVKSGTVSDDLVLKLYYNRNEYTITYYMNGGTNGSNPASYKYGEIITLQNPTGSTPFMGWYTTAEFVEGTEITKITGTTEGNINVYARWDGNIEDPSIPVDTYYLVTYDSAGGSEVVSESVLSGYAATEPDAPVKNGYIFTGWYLNGQLYDFSTILTSDITLVAGWEEETTDPGTISVSGITVQGGNQTIKVGDTITLSVKISPSNATNQNVTWSSSNPGVATVNPSTGLVTAVAAGTITITATAEDGSNVTGDCLITVEASQSTEDPVEPELPVTYTVAFNLNGGISATGISSQTVEEGQTATEPESPTREGYTFKEWQLNGESYDFNTAVTGNITLVAAWTENVIDNEDDPPATVLVSGIEINGGNQTIKIGDSFTLSAVVTPSEATYKSVAWSSSNPFIASVDPVTGYVQGLAVGKATINVTALDGSNVSQSCEITVEASETTEDPVEPDNPVTYTVTFNTNGGSEVTSQIIEEGKMVSQPATPVKDGYTFKEWQLSGVTYDFNTAVTANITLVAIWTENTSNDNEENPPVIDPDNPPIDIKVSQIVMTEVTKVIKVGDTVTLSATAYPENATDRIVTWITSDSNVATVDPVTGAVKGISAGIVNISAIAADGSGKKATCVITVQSTVVPDDSDSEIIPDEPDNDQTPQVTTYTVTFDSAGGSIIGAQLIEKGKVATMPAAPVREGYLFAGWYNGAVVYNFSDAVNSNLVLTAKWEAIQVSEIKIAGMSNKIAANKKIQLTAMVNEDALNKTVTWSVNNPKYASVSQTGLVKVKKAGKGKTVKVTATANDGSGVSKTYSIKIMHDAVKKITLTGNKSVKAGNKVTIKAKVSPIVSKKKMNKDLQWTTSNEEWATVTKKGVVKTYKAGKGKTVTITAKATDGSNKKKTFKIRIK